MPRLAPLVAPALALTLLFASGACKKDDPAPSSAESLAPSGSEVAVSTVSGALNNASGSVVAWNARPAPKRTSFASALEALDPIGTASAAEWTCTGGSLSPTFAGPAKNPYAFTPRSCSVSWGDNETGSSGWSGPFTLEYGGGCDATHAALDGQVTGCTITRTTGASGDTRTITGPDGSTYAITHDTDGAGTGWDASVSPAPVNGGVVLRLGTAQDTLVVNGSHLTGTVMLDGAEATIWDHTVSTPKAGLVVSGTGASRLVSGSVTVQHNLARFTSSTTFDAVGYGDEACCFPTTGRVSTTFSQGPDVGKTETLTFGSVCGETTLTRADGSSVPLVLSHCL